MTDALKTADVNLSLQYYLTNCLLLRSCQLQQHCINSEFMCLSVCLLWINQPKTSARISAVIVKNAIDVSIKTYPAWLAICTDALNSCISEGKIHDRIIANRCVCTTKLCNIAAILQLKQVNRHMQPSGRPEFIKIATS